MEQLKNRVTLYIPSTTKGNRKAPITQAREEKRATKYLCKLFGGATKTTASGYWVSDTKGLIKEKTTLIYSNCTDADLSNTLKGLRAYAKRLRERMTQEAITLEINGIIEFV